MPTRESSSTSLERRGGIRGGPTTCAGCRTCWLASDSSAGSTLASCHAFRWAAGLSSSASLEIAVGRALRDLYSLSLDDIALARAAQRAENEFVGAPVGIMDQMACLLADERAALFLDTRDLTFRRVHVPSAAGLVVIHSGISHRHAGGDYATRRRECDEAAARLRVATLRDLTDADAERIERLPSPLNRRARHVLTENNRVLATVEALGEDDLEEAGRLFVESHASLRDDYEVSVPEVDTLAQALAGLRGSVRGTDHGRRIRRIRRGAD